ncbi:MAG: Pyoverdin chromophore biosynthetic protein pvcC, partial [Gammaproteobacteria bacterium]|nr:Pyoverdin chromophore biosynthetic protein pvcC [Gammaproteobacteria bacterium]
MKADSKEIITDSLLTGDAYLESLDDGREVWFNGEQVKKVTDHPAFYNAARNTAKVYDALHDTALQGNLLLKDKLGITTHKFFAPSYSSQDLLEARGAIEIWQRINYGWLGRTP